MSNISILIVDDDFNKISSIIDVIRENFTENLIINQASCVFEAIEALKEKDFHLLITDLCMPLRGDDVPNNNGGESLIKEIYRKKKIINVPMYIVGITQFIELKREFKGFWKVLHYERSSSEWQINLQNIIFHISLVKSRISSEKKETIFVEGKTDRLILKATLGKFYDQHKEDINFETLERSAGASWVERQLFIWAKSLSKKKGSENYLKAVGIFDDDEAGNKAIENVKEDIIHGSAEDKTFAILKACYKYSPLLKSIKKKGIIFPTTIEDLSCLEAFKEAKKNHWLIKRDAEKITINKNIINLKIEDLNEDALLERGFDDNEILFILYKINDDFKFDYADFLITMESKHLINFSYLLEECLTKLKINV